ncbi:protein phosphatase [Scopulibacillus darangshiensis]|uniref:Protein phosphatase n=1 Tax=Scopulibacillus darangshiensis TaxID=442528 RepID=A0A4R2NL90_9BACL|nr:bis(5'-nucleosyl)-tetraphosphatase PrpE [Scopulibacillus darangshiensis]TCP22317.1 protein phosphatase [Scopulibacillus darangshiensis]
MFDIIGDIHGCFDEFKRLTEELGYDWTNDCPQHPENRQLVFLGDLTDRGPRSLKVVEVVYQLVKSQAALYVPGNHCNKLYRFMLGRPVQVKHGLETTVAELNHLNQKERKKAHHMFMWLYEKAPIYLTLEDGRLVIAHAGIREDYIGKTSKKVESFVLYGDTTGQKDERGLPERRDWAKHYRGAAWIVYGHTPVQKPRWKNRTVNIDTGCVFGGKLTALRYPEMATVSVPSDQPYVEEKFRSFEEESPQ